MTTTAAVWGATGFIMLVFAMIEEIRIAQKFKILMIGHERVGKSAIFNQYLNKDFNDQYSFTTGVDCGIKAFEKSGVTLGFEVWDTAVDRPGSRRQCRIARPISKILRQHSPV